MEQDPRLILQVPSEILAPSLRLHPSTASAFSRPITMRSGSLDRGVDLSKNSDSGIRLEAEHDSAKVINQQDSTGNPLPSSHHHRSRKHAGHSKKKIDVKHGHNSESDDMPGGGRSSPEHNSAGKMQQHSGPRIKLSFSVDSIISKETKSRDEGLREGDGSSCGRSSSPGSEEGSRPARDRTGTPDSDVHCDGESDSPREGSPRPESRDSSHHRAEFSPPIRPSAMPPGLAGLPYPFSPAAIGLPTWPGLSTAYHSLFPAGPAPATSTLPKLSSPESKYIDIHFSYTFFNRGTGTRAILVAIIMVSQNIACM